MREALLSQPVQVGGSLLILVAFALSQRGVLGHRSARYLVMNLVGSAVLAVQAAILTQWGFVLLEGVWAVVSATSLAGLRGRGAPARSPGGGMH